MCNQVTDERCRELQQEGREAFGLGKRHRRHLQVHRQSWRGFGRLGRALALEYGGSSRHRGKRSQGRREGAQNGQNIVEPFAVEVCVGCGGYVAMALPLLTFDQRELERKGREYMERAEDGRPPRMLSPEPPPRKPPTPEAMHKRDELERRRSMREAAEEAEKAMKAMSATNTDDSDDSDDDEYDDFGNLLGFEGDEFDADRPVTVDDSLLHKLHSNEEVEKLADRLDSAQRQVQRVLEMPGSTDQEEVVRPMLITLDSYTRMVKNLMRNLSKQSRGAIVPRPPQQPILDREIRVLGEQLEVVATPQGGMSASGVARMAALVSVLGMVVLQLYNLFQQAPGPQPYEQPVWDPPIVYGASVRKSVIKAKRAVRRALGGAVKN